MARNLYIHFPFCREKCAYCALYSRPGVSAAARATYVAALAAAVRALPPEALDTVYFGGGTPALCDLEPLLGALRPRLAASAEFTVELHPLDVDAPRLEALRAGGVNRISMGVQSFDDATLAAMGRGYTLDTAVRAFAAVTRVFDNAGIDAIVGFPGDPGRRALDRFAALGLRHCSVYALQNERGLKNVPDDDTVMDALRRWADDLADLGLRRYEISNYARPGYACRHNLAVWRGEDYLGLGEGACGRVGRTRTRGVRRAGALAYETETVTEEADRKERTLFRLRTREGLDTAAFPAWRPILDPFVREGLLRRADDMYFLTDRGTEVCDSLLAELV